MSIEPLSFSSLSLSLEKQKELLIGILRRGNDLILSPCYKRFLISLRFFVKFKKIMTIIF